jgi:GWxTD domain-containing protein
MRRPAVVLILAIAALAAACATYQLEKNLDPAGKDFLSKVRYLITTEERRSFVRLPEAERSRFIDEFWKKRDPNPDTVENEFKTQYFQRIDEANRLFSEGLEPGWLQDRGRIWILLGPPSEREAYPRGITFYGKPREIWYYNFFPIYFVDDDFRGSYRLDPESALQIGEIMRAQMEWKPQVDSEKQGLECDMTVERGGPDRITIRLAVPYKKIWMASDGKELRTTLKVDVAIQDASGAKIGDHHQDFPISLTEERMAEIAGQNHILEIPVTIEEGAAAFSLTLTNATDGSQAVKKAKLKA